MTLLARRSFLKGVLALAAVAAVAPRLVLLPRIVGDGVHDDAAGLNALFRGDPVSVETNGVAVSEGGEIKIHNGLFRLSRGLILPARNGPTLITCCIFRMGPSAPAEPVLSVSSRDFMITDNSFLRQ